MSPFTNSTLHIDKKGIDLLPNRFAYRHLDFLEIDQLRIEEFKGFDSVSGREN